MANKQIKDLTAVTSITDSDVLHVNIAQSGADRKIDLSNFETTFIGRNKATNTDVIAENDITLMTPQKSAFQISEKIASQAEAISGTDNTVLMTPLRVNEAISNRTASTTQAGTVELATDSETQTGTDSNRAVTPASLSSRGATESRTGLVELANNAEALAGNDNFRAMSPVRVHEAFKQFGLGRAVNAGSNVDLNTLTDAGFYRIDDSPVNAPNGSVEFGQVIVSRGGDTVLQIITGFNNGRIWWRQGNPTEAGGSGSYGDWHEFYTTERPNVDARQVIGTTFITRIAPVTLLNRVAGGSFTTTLNGPSFGFADNITLNKGQSSGTWTVSLSSGNFIYPNGTADNSLTIPSGFSYAISLHRRGDGNFEITVLG